MSRTNTGQSNRKKPIFGWTVIHKVGGKTKVGIVRAPTWAKAKELIRERYSEISWSLMMRGSLEGPLFDEIYEN